MKDHETLTRHEAANYLGINIRTLDKWRHDGNGPAYLDLSLGNSLKPSIRYRGEDLEDFLKKARCCPISNTCKTKNNGSGVPSTNSSQTG